MLTSLQGPSHHGKLSCGEGSGRRLSRSPPPQCQSVVVSKEQNPEPCEHPTTMASLLSFQLTHEEAFRLLSHFIVTCSTWMSITVTADPSSLPNWAVGPFEEMPSSGWSVRNEPIAIAHIPSRREQLPETLARVGRFCCKISMSGQCGWSLTIRCEKLARAPPERKGGAARVFFDTRKSICLICGSCKFCGIA